MTFNWDVIQHEATKAPFEFTADGKKWRVPHVSDLLVGQQLSVDAGHVAEVLRDVAEVWQEPRKGSRGIGKWVAAEVEAQKLILGRHADQVGVFIANWLAWAGLEQGESEASPR